eukprot:gene930-biopygen7960
MGVDSGGKRAGKEEWSAKGAESGGERNLLSAVPLCSLSALAAYGRSARMRAPFLRNNVRRDASVLHWGENILQASATVERVVG